MELIKSTEERYCIECSCLCFVYDQGLSCHCGNGAWDNEEYYEEDYPTKWIRVTVRIYTVPAQVSDSQDHA